MNAAPSSVPIMRPAAAEKARATDDDGSDHIEFFAESRFRRAGLQPRGKDDASERRAEAGDDIGADLDPRDVDSRQSRGEFAAADRVEVEAETRAAEDERAAIRRGRRR